jgi:hypothetical protein
MNDNSKTGGGVGFLGLLAIAFIVLKLTGHISWSWWLILSPIWGPFAIGVLLVILWIGARIIKYGGSNETYSDRE